MNVPRWISRFEGNRSEDAVDWEEPVVLGAGGVLGPLSSGDEGLSAAAGPAPQSSARLERGRTPAERLIRKGKCPRMGARNR
jgi:hypothetical protein